MVDAPDDNKTCWTNTPLDEWDLDIYAEYDYATRTGSKPITQQVCRDVFQLLKDRQEKRGAHGRALLRKAPFTDVIPYFEEARIRLKYPKRVSGEGVRAFLRRIGVFNHAPLAWPTPPGCHFARRADAATGHDGEGGEAGKNSDAMGPSTDLSSGAGQQRACAWPVPPCRSFARTQLHTSAQQSEAVVVGRKAHAPPRAKAWVAKAAGAGCAKQAGPAGGARTHCSTPVAAKIEEKVTAQPAVGAGGLGQAGGVERAGTCCTLPGLNINWPFSQLILAGVKTAEARAYDLGYHNIAHPHVEMWLMETPGDAKAITKGWALAGDARIAPRPQHAQIVGSLTFSRADRYESLESFRSERECHRIGQGGAYDWQGAGDMYAWRVSGTRRLVQPVPQPGRKGVTGFAKPRPFTVLFADDAHPAPQLSGEGAACTPAPPRGGRQQGAAMGGRRLRILGKRESTDKAASRGPAKRPCPPPAACAREGLFFEAQEGGWCGMHALNNFCLQGRMIGRQDCRAAAACSAARGLVFSNLDTNLK